MISSFVHEKWWQCGNQVAWKVTTGIGICQKSQELGPTTNRGGWFLCFVGEKFKKIRACFPLCRITGNTRTSHPSDYHQHLFTFPTSWRFISKQNTFTLYHQGCRHPKTPKHFFHLLVFSVAKRTPSKQPVLEMDFSMVISNPVFHGKDDHPIGFQASAASTLEIQGESFGGKKNNSELK